MVEKTLKVLEFDKIIDKLQAKAASKAGQKRCRDLEPLTSINRIHRLQEETKEASLVINELGNPPLFGIYDLSEPLGYAEKSGVLSPSSLMEISSSLRVAAELKDYLDKTEILDKIGLIIEMVTRLDPVRPLQKEIDRIIISQDEIADNASPKLMSIRSSLARKHDQVRAKVSSIINSNSVYLQDNIATIRDGRHVVPVKSQYRNTFKGIVHDQSSSGATVFIEPMAVVEINNEIKILLEDEREEIERILKVLSKRVAENSVKIKANQNILIDLDFIFARAKLAIEMDGIYPKLNTDGLIRLVEARHPLLEGKVVPISLDLGYDFTTLLITGPNTGGKTVSLKTVGLLILMAQSGLHVPADLGTELAVFNNIFADIGDEQSIEQSLSTFSSHMVNIVDILKKVDEKSLVLFDELGAGTDPAEGSALAISILDFLLKKSIRTMATTHYSELKIYALNTPGVENASVEFDLKTLSPTYKLVVGTVGKSNAFEISRRLGIPEEIISYASGLLSSDNKSFEDALIKIEDDRKTIEELRNEIEKKEEDAKKINKRLESQLKGAEKQKEKILKEAKSKAAAIVEEARIQAKDSIKELNKLRSEARGGSISRAHEIKRELDESAKNTQPKSLDFLDVKTDERVEDLKLGDEVEVLSLSQSGQVVELPNANGDLVVEIGILKINTNIDQIKRSEAKDIKDSKTSLKKIIKTRIAKSVKTEIDLRGKNIEEARMDLDTYLDDAFLSGLKEVRIIHGKGTGVLREAVQDYLRKHKLVEDFRLGTYDEGSDGVTVAKLKG